MAARLPILIVVPLVAAAGLAWVLKFAYIHDWYWVIVLPGLAGLALGGVLYAVVAWSHCRNRWLAVTVAVASGLVAYLGYYEICLLERLPPGLPADVDSLPEYISFRMQTDVAEDVGKPQVGQQPKKPSAFLNWSGFGLELLMVVGWAVGLPWRRASRAYSVELGQWMRRDKALLLANSSKPFLDALENGKLAEFVAHTPPGSDAQTACHLILEYAVPGEGLVFHYPIYASLQEYSGPRPWHLPQWLPLPRTVLRQVELELGEVVALRPLFPRLSQLLALQHTELRGLPADVMAAPTVEAPVSDSAEITPVPEPFRQRVRGKDYALKVNLIGLLTAIYFFGGVGLLAWGIWRVTQGSIPVGCTAIAIGAIGFLWGGYLALYALGVPENRWINRRLRREIGQRSDPLVDPADPESVYVSLIPRESFSKIKWTMASDVLLLKLDERRRMLVMEGDTDRYRIPAGAISVCEPQCFYHPADQQHHNQLWMIRLMIRVEQGLRELLLGVAHTRFTPLTNARRRRTAEEMCERINRLRS
jgi:hypothetical protein